MLATQYIKIFFISLFLGVILLDAVEHLLGMDHIEICVEEEGDNKEDTLEQDLQDKLFRLSDKALLHKDDLELHRYIYLELDAKHILVVPSPPPDLLS